MQRKMSWWGIGVVVLAMSVGALAQSAMDDDSGVVHFRGLINDYSAANVKPAGPWRIVGVWSLTLKGRSGRADFSASLSMVESDYWVIANSKDVNDPQSRTPHTHHIVLTDGVVTPLTNGFRVSGPVSISGSGNPAPFGSSSTLTIDVTGGSTVAYSNIQLTFGGDAVAHFGMQPLDGVVRKGNGGGR